MIFQLSPKRAYGRTIYYPHCEFSKLICGLLKQKSLTDFDVSYIKEKGHTISLIDSEIGF